MQDAASGSKDSLEFQHVYVQLETVRSDVTKSNKPYFELTLVDATAKSKIKIWSDTAAFEFCKSCQVAESCELEGRFFVNDFGLNVLEPRLRRLSDEEKDAFFSGTAEQQQRIEIDWAYVTGVVEQMEDSRLRLVTSLALQQFEKKWKRAAAARSYHHARRGGLIEHTSQMMRCAKALAPLYQEVHEDLLCAGVLFHDIGKLVENDLGAEGFAIQQTRTGELIGHISIGIEMVNKLWHEAEQSEPELFKEAQPSSLVLRDYLLHLIASHHGEMAFGSPVIPKMPEAWLLHYIDNIDAKIEILRGSYARGMTNDAGFFEAQRPLTGFIARPLNELTGQNEQE